MAIKTLNKSGSWVTADYYPPGFYSAHEIIMPEEGWLNKIGGVCASDSSGTFKFFLTTQTTPGTGSATESLLWMGSTTHSAVSGNFVFEEDLPDIYVVSGQKIYVCMYAASGEARFCYENSAGSYILDGPYGGGPVPPDVPLTAYTAYNDYRYAQWIEYDDTNPGGGSSTGKLKYYNGTAWVEKSLKYWDGTEWVAKPLKYWNGTAWVLA